MSVLDILLEAGLNDTDSSLHSWRCAYPDRYSPCTCLADLVTDLEAECGRRAADAIAAAVQRVEALYDAEWQSPQRRAAVIAAIKGES